MAQHDALKALENQMKALELAKAGVSYRLIAETVGYKSSQAAWAAVKSALKKVITPAAEEVRLMEIERLDAALMAVWPSVTKGQYGAIDRFLRIQERRAKLLGLDAPARQDITSGGEKIGWKDFISGNTDADSE